jgi:hypothetical protein
MGAKPPSPRASLRSISSMAIIPLIYTLSFERLVLVHPDREHSCGLKLWIVTMCWVDSDCSANELEQSVQVRYMDMLSSHILLLQLRDSFTWQIASWLLRTDILCILLDLNEKGAYASRLSPACTYFAVTVPQFSRVCFCNMLCRLILIFEKGSMHCAPIFIHGLSTVERSSEA